MSTLSGKNRVDTKNEQIIRTDMTMLSGTTFRGFNIIVENLTAANSNAISFTPGSGLRLHFPLISGNLTIVSGAGLVTSGSGLAITPLIRTKELQISGQLLFTSGASITSSGSGLAITPLIQTKEVQISGQILLTSGAVIRSSGSGLAIVPLIETARIHVSGDLLLTSGATFTTSGSGITFTNNVTLNSSVSGVFHYPNIRSGTILNPIISGAIIDAATINNATFNPPLTISNTLTSGAQLHYPIISGALSLVSGSPIVASGSGLTLLPNVITSGKLIGGIDNSYTYFVYAEGSTYKAKNMSGIVEFSDSTLSGFTTVTQLALDKMSGIGGGKLLIDKGTHLVHTTTSGGGRTLGLMITTSNTTVEGMGHSTLLYQVSVTGNTITNWKFQSGGAILENVMIKNLMIDGHREDNPSPTNRLLGHGLLQIVNCDHLRIDNVYVKNGQGMGFNIAGRIAIEPRESIGEAGSGRWAYITSCRAENCNDNGFDLATANIHMSNCYAKDNNKGTGGNGAGTGDFDFDSPEYCVVTNCTAEGGKLGFSIQGGSGRGNSFNNLENLVVIGTSSYGLRLGGSVDWNSDTSISGQSIETKISNVHMKTLGLDGVELHHGVNDIQMNNIVVDNASGIGISIHQGCKRVNITNAKVYGAGNMGVLINSGCVDVSLTNVNVDLSGALTDCFRILASSNNVKLTNCTATHGRFGFYVQQCVGTKFIGCIAHSNNGYGFQANGAKKALFQGCTAYNNAIANSGINDGFLLTGDATVGTTSQSRIIGCESYDTAAAGSKPQRYGIALTGYATDNEIMENDVSGNGFSGVFIAQLSSTNNLIRFNKGFVTEAQGRASGTADGVASVFTIPHTCVQAPTYVNVTPITSGAGNYTSGGFTVSGGATNINIKYWTVPANNTEMAWYWKGEVS